MIEDSPNKNMLLARLCGYSGWLKAAVEPVQAVLEHFALLYNAGMAAGDSEGAMLSRWSYCAASFYIGVDLVGLSKNCILFLQQAVG